MRFAIAPAFFYTRVVLTLLNYPYQLPLWRRIAALLSFLAVVSALIAPASMLAEEVRTGKLGGLCSLSKAVDGAGGVTGDVKPDGQHCDLCGSLALAAPLFAEYPLPSQPDQHLASVDFSFDWAALVEGLPPSRGPPAS